MTRRERLSRKKEIKQLRKMGCTFKEIAKVFGVSQPRAVQIYYREVK